MYKKDILLVDGYNIIHGWDSLKKIADYSLEDARVKLIEILRDYQGSKGITIIIVFDSHYVKSKVETIEQFDMLKVVYTKEAESADNYIEKITGDLAKIYRVTVATSDYLEQIIVIGKGAIRISAREFEQEVKRQKKYIRDNYTEKRPVKNNLFIDNLDPKTAELLEKIRLNKDGFKDL